MTASWLRPGKVWNRRIGGKRCWCNLQYKRQALLNKGLSLPGPLTPHQRGLCLSDAPETLNVFFSNCGTCPWEQRPKELLLFVKVIPPKSCSTLGKWLPPGFFHKETGLQQTVAFINRYWSVNSAGKKTNVTLMVPTIWVWVYLTTELCLQDKGLEIKKEIGLVQIRSAPSQQNHRDKTLGISEAFIYEFQRGWGPYLQGFVAETAKPYVDDLLATCMQGRGCACLPWGQPQQTSYLWNCSFCKNRNEFFKICILKWLTS